MSDAIQASDVTVGPTATATATSVQLDWANVDELGVELERECARFGIEYEVVNEHGPAGGYPVVRFSGHAMRLGALLWEYFDRDPEPFLEFVR